MGKLEKWTVEFYTAIASYKWSDLESYIEALNNSTLDNLDNSEVQHKSELYDKPACPVDPFLRVMCEGCQ